jgi:2-methylcitrate dehydratase
MRIHSVKAEKKSGDLKKEDQLAYKLARLAVEAKNVPFDNKSLEMVKCRIIDNAAISIGAINQKAVIVARDKAMSSEGTGNATIYGFKSSRRFDPSRAAFANAVAVRFLDQDDTYLAAEYSHPDDNISPILAVAQNLKIKGEDFIRGIIVAYEIHVALVGTGKGTGICLHEHKVDHMTHIAAATAAGICSMLDLSLEQTYHAINFAVHNAISSRQSRKGDIGSQKEFVPGFSAQISIDAVDSAMRDLKGPNPVYEGVDSIIRRFLNGKDNAEAEYKIELAEAGKDPLKNILITYPKEHAFEYQGQAIIDATLDLKKEITELDIGKIRKVILETSHHTHHVIGTDANDPQKIDPDSPRGTLDHSIMFAIARTLQIGEWHHERTYQITDEEKEDLRGLMKKIETKFEQKWEDAYHSQDPKVQAFGGKLVIELEDGSVFEKEKSRANAHCYGDTPWGREEYIGKFDRLTSDKLSSDQKEYFLNAVDFIDTSNGDELFALTPEMDLILLDKPEKKGLFIMPAESPKKEAA